MRLALVLALLLTTAISSGCVRRTITVNTNPPGALVWLNDREVGRSPVQVDFLYYGRYDVRLEREGSEPLMTSGNAVPPLWDTVPLDLAAELMPTELHSRTQWHYDLPPRDDDPNALLARARELRGRVPGQGDNPASGRR